MKITEKSNSFVEIATDAAHILHLIGSDDYPEIRRAMVKADDVENWEEVAVADLPPYNESEYKGKVTELIRQRYSADDEFALINNMMYGANEKRQSEYEAYQQFREQCKDMAKVELTKGGAECHGLKTW